MNADELRRIPDRDELRQALVRYFGPSITDAHVDQLLHDVQAILGDRPRYRGAVGVFAPGNTFGEGEAWKEEHVGTRSVPTPLDLALMRAASSREKYPPPLPYCPPALVGRWEMTARGDGIALDEPHPEWNLSADGSFRATGDRARDARWCAHKIRDQGDNIWLFPRNLPGRTTFVVKSVGDTEMTLRSVNRSGRLLSFRRM
jgi:hypothetical protein